MTLRFGTDGVRGVANTELTPELALALGRAAARTLGLGPWLIGRDPRASGPMLGAAFSAGLASEGAVAVDLGVLPTPAVAFLAARDQLPGAMISASHNPFADNGIKLFGVGGLKLDDATEAELEAALEMIESEGIPGGSTRPSGAQVGFLRASDEAWEIYAQHLVTGTLEGRRFRPLKVVIDCAHGAASAVAPQVLAQLGATVTVINAEPDGLNINEGAGSTDVATLQAVVEAKGADIGLALDGDADRVLAVDSEGGLVDGDQIIAMLAVDLHERGLLHHDTVVVTIMSNLGFRLAMAAHGIEVIETPVGDRHVLAALEANGLVLGGEQSGHVIRRDLATTGDGLLAGISILDLMSRSGKPLAELASVMSRLPQVLHNVRVTGSAAAIVEDMAPSIAEAVSHLGDRGRILVRPSGTEPLVRVMVEAPSEDEAERIAKNLTNLARG